MTNWEARFEAKQKSKQRYCIILHKLVDRINYCSTVNQQKKSMLFLLLRVSLLPENTAALPYNQPIYLFIDFSSRSRIWPDLQTTLGIRQTWWSRITFRTLHYLCISAVDLRSLCLARDSMGPPWTRAECIQRRLPTEFSTRRLTVVQIKNYSIRITGYIPVGLGISSISLTNLCSNSLESVK